MKLRNKKTGEIGYLRSTNWNETALIIMDKNGVQLAKYGSLAELNEEWEDYEEPKESKEYYFIAEYGRVYPVSAYEDYNLVNFDDYIQIGNYFETKEEAEKAVEKLKAWKRLKAQGLTFCGWNITDDGCSVDVETTLDAEIVRAQQKYITDDLNLIFGGER